MVLAVLSNRVVASTPSPLSPQWITKPADFAQCRSSLLCSSLQATGEFLVLIGPICHTQHIHQFDRVITMCFSLEVLACLPVR